MKIKPLGDRVLIKLQDAEVVKGNIIIPDTAREEPLEGTVIAVGSRFSLFNINPGDRVLVKKYSGTEIGIFGVRYLIVSQEDILAITNAPPLQQHSLQVDGITGKPRA